jgi:hypothetical protein
LALPLLRFPGSREGEPEEEKICKGWSGFIAEIAPNPAPVIQQKEQVPYHIAGTLKEAEFVHKTREWAIRNGRSTVGKQRSNAHIESLGPVILLDDDGDAFARETRLGHSVLPPSSTARIRTAT